MANSTPIARADIIRPYIAALAMALTLSCSSDVESPQPPSALSSSSLDANTVLCLYNGNCNAVSNETCSVIGGQVVQSCPTVSSSSVALSSSSIMQSSSSGAQSSSSSSLQISSSSKQSGIVYGQDVEYGDEIYKTVVIGTQTWFQSNLNLTGNRCYNNVIDNCTIYGRLYKWATAMDLPSSCNSISCSSQISAKHKGICPSGWHIPSEADWNTLKAYIENDKNCTNCDAKHLKTVSGWYSEYSYNDGNGTDSYGFSALPGGNGYDNYFNSVDYEDGGDHGYWWSASESNGSTAYVRGMEYYGENTYWGYGGKSYYYSVRCLKD